MVQCLSMGALNWIVHVKGLDSMSVLQETQEALNT